jgi:hypothetical protein
MMINEENWFEFPLTNLIPRDRGRYENISKKEVREID